MIVMIVTATDGIYLGVELRIGTSGVARAKRALNQHDASPTGVLHGTPP
jgi:hypothetical protein